jgi:hypothetical protein
MFSYPGTTIESNANPLPLQYLHRRTFDCFVSIFRLMVPSSYPLYVDNAHRRFGQKDVRSLRLDRKLLDRLNEFFQWWHVWITGYIKYILKLKRNKAGTKKATQFSCVTLLGTTPTSGNTCYCAPNTYLVITRSPLHF